MPDFREREKGGEREAARSGGGSGRAGEFERRARSEVGGERKREVRGVEDGGGDGGEEGWLNMEIEIFAITTGLK
ncbi:hypothetical protein TIFTF001_011796 [Ficus carica]|uniref:Uncharacterized protein n=1 Tax=Ficus carica TaxID=3494 RepID=A0AA88AME2_FICCA|nr:hypothetical protein TIFTF001_011796 [Ficus carica]